ncbi:MAG: bifunctional diguanylate cyclase/phosphodiesterase [Burkholderiaceae bacterium]
MGLSRRIDRRVNSLKKRYAWLRGSLPFLIGCPLFCLALIVVVWTAAFAKITAERDALRRGGFQDAAALADSYAKQVSQAVGHLDEHTRSLAFEWRESGGALQLERRAVENLYQNENELVFGFADANGQVVSTLPAAAKRSITLSDSPQFMQYRMGLLSGFQIKRIESGRFIKKPLVVFTRSLQADAGAFSGVVFVSVSPDYLASFYDEPLHTQDDVVAVLDRQGGLIASVMGENVRSHRTIVKRPIDFPGPRGIKVVPGDYFIDGLPRVVAWHDVAGYPLISVSLMTEKGIYAGLAARRLEYIGLALAATLFALLAGATGIVFSTRLALRRHQARLIRRTYRLATDNAREAFFMVRKDCDGDGKLRDFIIEDCNERGAEFLRLPMREAIGSPVSRLFRNEPDGMLKLYRRLQEKGFYEDEFLTTPRNPAHARWMQRRLAATDENAFAVTLRDISEARQHAIALAELANTDALTGLPNRHWLAAGLPRCLERADAAGRKVALLFVDLDDFRDINNTEGHAAGDALLRAVAQRIKGLLRPEDHVVRLGGDEFTLILEDVVDAAQAARIVERLDKELAAPYALGEYGFQSVRASIGISLYPDHGADLDTLMQHADIAMYAAKANGKGRYQFYEPDFSEAIVRKITTLQALRRAIALDQFVVHYQPRVDTRTGELRSFEALVRWQHPERGMVPPAEFIPLAEESGLIVEIGAQVLDKACRQLADWIAQGLPARPVSVNVSARQFQSNGLEAAVRNSLVAHGIAPSLLELEITESCMMADRARVPEELAALKAMGIRLSVDDFGTGYSSLSQLQQLDVDVLKIDRSFTRMLTDGEQHRAFFMTILAMARVLEMRVVAEGVETIEQLRVLQTMACDEVQGYLVSKPVDPGRVPELLRSATLFGWTPAAASSIAGDA